MNRTLMSMRYQAGLEDNISICLEELDCDRRGAEYAAVTRAILEDALTDGHVDRHEARTLRHRLTVQAGLAEQALLLDQIDLQQLHTEIR